MIKSNIESGAKNDSENTGIDNTIGDNNPDKESAEREGQESIDLMAMKIKENVNKLIESENFGINNQESYDELVELLTVEMKKDLELMDAEADDDSIGKIIAQKIAVLIAKGKSERFNEHERENDVEQIKRKKEEIVNKLLENGGSLSQPIGNINQADFEYKLLAASLPSFMEWARKQENGGVIINFSDFVKTEDISSLELDIIIKKIDEYKKEEAPVEMSAETLYEISHGCDAIRKQAHVVLAEMGNLVPNIGSIKNVKLNVRFENWGTRLIDRINTTTGLSLNGLQELMHGFAKFWQAEAKLDQETADMDGAMMGEMQHAFLLKDLSRRIEDAIGFMEKSIDAKEVSFYNSQLKKHLALLVEWNNEYRRLYKVQVPVAANEQIKTAYDVILDRSFRIETSTRKDIFPGEKVIDNDKELDKYADREKKEVCSKMLKKISNLQIYWDKHSSYDNKERKLVQELRDKILELEKAKNISEIEIIAADVKRIIYEDREAFELPSWRLSDMRSEDKELLADKWDFDVLDDFIAKVK